MNSWGKPPQTTDYKIGFSGVKKNDKNNYKDTFEWGKNIKKPINKLSLQQIPLENIFEKCKTIEDPASRIECIINNTLYQLPDLSLNNIRSIFQMILEDIKKIKPWKNLN
ncbi:MAG: hypothetical protein LBR15_03810 [Methanobrevibacter sp.]|jgi:hypothetical protein|nr:hypothetical protein [Candidatus Methanovirga australis]